MVLEYVLKQDKCDNYEGKCDKNGKILTTFDFTGIISVFFIKNNIFEMNLLLSTSIKTKTLSIITILCHNFEVKTCIFSKPN